MTRLRLQGALEEARRVERIMLQSMEEEAMVFGTTEDGEQDATLLKSAGETEFPEEIEREELNETTIP